MRIFLLNKKRQLHVDASLSMKFPQRMLIILHAWTTKCKILVETEPISLHKYL